jgi:glycosyltransferase involved in cell wall biosynthesis
MDNSLVSIIIPVYNREEIISETLDCAINQTYKNIEIIVSDNCSTDNTWSVLEEYAKKDDRIKIFRNEVNVGPVLNWKKGIDKLQGEYTKIVWSDDLISLDFVEKAIEMFDADTSFVMSGVRTFNSEDNATISETKFQNKRVYTREEYLKDVLLFNIKDFPISPGCALFRTKDIKSSYIEQIHNNENLDFKKYGAGNDLLFFLITANKYKYVKTINEVSSFFRAHQNSFSVSNNLIVYYEYAKWFFISNQFVSIKKDYKCKLSLENKLQPELATLNECNNEKLFFFSLLLFRIRRSLYSNLKL